MVKTDNPRLYKALPFLSGVRIFKAAQNILATDLFLILNEDVWLIPCTDLKVSATGRRVCGEKSNDHIVDP